MRNLSAGEQRCTDPGYCDKTMQGNKTGTFTFRIILTQGLNRQIRRMCQYLGYEVQKLKRIRIMNLTLDGIKEGEYREITDKEWKELKELLSTSTSETVTETGGHHGNSGNQANERAGAEAGRGGKGLLSERHRNHKQPGIQSDVRRASGSGKETGTVLANSPTIRVGYEAVEQLPKEEHEFPDAVSG